MSPINTDHWLTMSESFNAWSESPKYIVQYCITELVLGYGVPPVPGDSLLIQVCQQQLSQLLVRLFPIPEYLCNSLLFCIPYLLVRKLMIIILHFNDVSKVMNCWRVIFLQCWNKFYCKKISIHHSTIFCRGKGYTTVRTHIRCDHP